MNEKIEQLKNIIEESENIVFFGGAGVSTESGIPDFRSADGIYNQKLNREVSPEEMISRTFYEKHPEDFFAFYRDKLIYPNAQPNYCHKALAELEAQGKLSAVVTQNIDGLHQKAGSKTVYELHGSVLRNYCTQCHAFYDESKILGIDPEAKAAPGNGLASGGSVAAPGSGLASGGSVAAPGSDYASGATVSDNASVVPICDKCGGIIKPDVVLYEECLDDNVIDGAVRSIERADTLIIGGTTLIVYPAAGLIRYFQGKNLVLINKSATPADDRADLVIHDSIGEVFRQVMGW